MKKLLFGCIAAIAMTFSFSSCNSDRITYEGPNYLMFSDTLYRYAVPSNDSVFNVPVSATRSADYNRTFAVEIVDSLSEAIEGKHFNLLSNTVTIEAGKLSANVQIRGHYNALRKEDVLPLALRLVVPKENQWKKYGIDSKVILQKSCPFDINNFTGYCKVTSTYFQGFMQNVDFRLIKTELNPKKKNSIILHNPYYDGHDLIIEFDPSKLLSPKVLMEEQILTTTGEVFQTIFGDGYIRAMQPTAQTSFFNTCEDYVLQFLTFYVKGKGTLGTFLTVYEWIDDAEAEKLKEQGY